MRVEIMRVKPSKYAKILWDIVLTGLPVTLNISVMNRDRDPELFLMCSMGMNWSRNSQGVDESVIVYFIYWLLERRKKRVRAVTLTSRVPR